MPDINANVVDPQDLTADVATLQAEVTGTVAPETGELSGTITSNEGAITANVNSGTLTVSAAVDSNDEQLGTTLTVHYGADGKPGKDGVSPIIDVYKDTPSEYILKITDVRGSFLTPNLYPDIEEYLKIEGKVDEDLAKYPLINPLELTHDQRENTFLYIRRDDLTANQNQKISLDQVALNAEVDEKIRLKLQTVEQRPEDWRVGDYIFLEQNSGESD